jgi:hypothetical protein
MPDEADNEPSERSLNTKTRQNVAPGQILLGHLAITIPVVLAVPLVVYWGLGEFGPLLWPYYVTAGIRLGWQWYSMALPRWEGVLTRSGLQVNQIEDVARRSGLVWPGAGAIGSFALHTTAVLVCGIFIGPWVFSRWFVWILPLSRIGTNDRVRVHETVFAGDKTKAGQWDRLATGGLCQGIAC